MSVLKGNNPVHRGRTLRQTNHGRTSTKTKRDVNERPRDPPPFQRSAYGRRPRELTFKEGPLFEPGDRCLIVEDVVTTGGSTLEAIDAVRSAGHEIAGVITVLDRLAGGAERIRVAADGAPYEPLATIDDVYPERPDR
jgi:orotate phosphoribosyltransferase